MGILDKVAFWKKNDDFGDADFSKDPFANDLGSPDAGFGSTQPPLGHDHQNDPGMTPPMGDAQGFSGAPPMGGPDQFQSSPNFNQPIVQPAQQQPFSAAENTEIINSKTLEVISSKIDALKASLDSINQRLAHLEQIASNDDSSQQPRNRFY